MLDQTHAKACDGGMCPAQACSIRQAKAYDVHKNLMQTCRIQHRQNLGMEAPRHRHGCWEGPDAGRVGSSTGKTLSWRRVSQAWMQTQAGA
eukprot:1158651-Pelagomonas_calceolata.AAC.6